MYAAALTAGATAATLFYTLNGSGANETQDANGDYVSDEDTDDLVDCGKGDIALIATAAVGTIGTIIANKLVAKQPDPKHPAPTAKIEISDGFVQIISGPAKNAGVYVHKDGDFTVKAKRNIKMDAKGTMLVKVTGKLDVKSQAVVNLGGMVKHKNITVLA